MAEARRRIVVIGGGFAGLAAARELAHDPGLELTLFNSSPTLYNYPLVPRTLFEPIAAERVAVPLAPLLAVLPLRLVTEKVVAIDAERRQVATPSATVAYDQLLIATGSRARPLFDRVAPVYYPKASRHLERLRGELGERLDLLRRGEAPERRWHYVVVGGGLTGIEFAAALRELADRACAARGLPADRVAVTLCERARGLAPKASARVGRSIARRLRGRGIELALGEPASGFDAGRLRIGARRVAADTILACIGGRPNLPREIAGLGDTANGIPVDDALRACARAEVFAAGDIALGRWPESVTTHSAQAAVAQGVLAARNMLRARRGEPLHDWDPRDRPFGVMLGARDALLQAHGLLLGGRVAAVLKRHTELRGPR